MIFSESIDWFLAQVRVEMGYSSHTLEAYARELARYESYLREKHGVDSIGQVRTEHLQGFMIELIEKHKLGEFSLARALSALRTFHRCALRERWVDENPAALIDPPRLHRKLPAVLSIEEVEALINACPQNDAFGFRNRAMIELLYASGLRVSELVQLRLSDISLSEGFVRVLGKGNRERLAPFGAPASAAIEQYLIEGRPQLSVSSETWLFLNRYGKILSRQSIFLLIQQKAAEAGINKTISPHTMRHSFATHLIENGADLVAVRDLLGHSSINTTEIYVHTDSRRLREVVDRFHPMAQKSRNKV